jgi:predicted RNA-binding Zn-ribbon protein involved in translation (DUF1610 family)
MKFGKQGLHCDKCHHEIDIAELVESMVDMPCDKCGANMLTRVDYERAVYALTQLASLRKAGLIREADDGSNGVGISIHAKNGNIDITVTNPAFSDAK